MNERTSEFFTPDLDRTQPTATLMPGAPLAEAKELQQLSREVASARTRIGKGEAVDLSGLPERMRSLFAQTIPLDKKTLENAVVALMAECDGLVSEIETMQERLGRDIRQDQQHRSAASAYRPKSPD